MAMLSGSSGLFSAFPMNIRAGRPESRDHAMQSQVNANEQWFVPVLTYRNDLAPVWSSSTSCLTYVEGRKQLPVIELRRAA